MNQNVITLQLSCFSRELNGRHRMITLTDSDDPATAIINKDLWFTCCRPAQIVKDLYRLINDQIKAAIATTLFINHSRRIQ